MIQISNTTDNRDRITIVSKKDLEFSYFVGPGNGGQKKQKTHSGCQVKHVESGAVGRCSEHRQQEQNKRLAFERMTQTPKFKFWLAAKLYEIRQNETIQEAVERDMDIKNLKFEIKDDKGRWTEVDNSFFDTQEAKTETI